MVKIFGVILMGNFFSVEIVWFMDLMGRLSVYLNFSEFFGESFWLDYSCSFGKFNGKLRISHITMKSSNSLEFCIFREPKKLLRASKNHERWPSLSPFQKLASNQSIIGHHLTVVTSPLIIHIKYNSITHKNQSK